MTETPSPGGADDAWADFERRLASVLERMPPETYLVLEAPAAAGETQVYVQFAAATAGFRAEAVSSRYLPASHPLTPAQERRLARLGWKRPEPAAAGQNFFLDWPAPAPFVDVARLAVRTLREVYRVEQPSGLRYLHESFRHEAVTQPDLGIESRSGRVPSAEAPMAGPAMAGPAMAGPAMADLAALLEEAVGRWLGVELPARDPDGDFPIRVGSALMFVRLLEGRPPAVAVFAPILRDVARTADLLAALNDVNSRIRFGRVFWSDAQVLVATELTGLDISANQIAYACVELGNLADTLDDLLHGRFGGKTMFDEGPTLQN